MKTRIISSVVGLPIIIFLITLGGVYLQILCLIISIIGLHEFYKAVCPKSTLVHKIGYSGIIGYYGFLPFFSNSNSKVTAIAFVAIYIIISFIFFVINNKKVSIEELSLGIFGFLYVGVSFSFIYLISEISVYFVWFIFICAWGADTFAYFAGKTFGKHKLAPVLSPKKTIEGAIGGVIGSILLSVLYGTLAVKYGYLSNITLLQCVVIGGFGAILSMFGDLSASAIKRQKNIKDYGTLIPGHGGILDRFDSVLFTAPTVFITILICR